jgi:hypothetical protein
LFAEHSLAGVLIRGLAAFTDRFFSENPRTDAPGNDQRLYSSRRVTVTCDGNGAPQVRKGTITTRSGPETISVSDVTISLQPDPPRVLTDSESRSDGTDWLARVTGSTGQQSIRLTWGVWGTPPLKSEPPFAAVCPRTSRRIWHKITVAFKCSAPNAEPELITRTLTGSQFPSHRIWIDGELRETVNQGSFARLWHAQDTLSSFVA